MGKNGNRTFVKITNQNIYEELQELKTHILDIKGSVKNNKKDITLNRKLIWLLMGACGTAFMFIIGQMLGMV